MVSNTNQLQHVSPNKKIYELKKNIIATNSYYHSSNNSTSFNKIVYPSNISGSTYNHHTRNKSTNVTGALLIEDNNNSLNTKSQSSILKPRQKIIDKHISKSLINQGKSSQNNNSNNSNLTNSKSNSEVNSLITSNLNSNSRNINKDNEIKKYSSNYCFNYKKPKEIKDKKEPLLDKDRDALYKSYLNTEFNNKKSGLTSFNATNKPVSVLSNNDKNYLYRENLNSNISNNNYLNVYSRNSNNYNTPLSFLTNPTPYNQLGSINALNNTNHNNLSNINNIPNLNVNVSHIRIDLGNSTNNNNYLNEHNNNGNLKNIDKILNNYDHFRNTSLEYNISNLKNEVSDEDKTLNENILENIQLQANKSIKINNELCDTEYYQKTVSSINNELNNNSKNNNENKENLLFEIDEYLKSKYLNINNIQKKIEQKNEIDEKVFDNIEIFTDYRSLCDEINKTVSLIISREKNPLNSSLSKNYNSIFNKIIIGLNDAFFKIVSQLNSIKEKVDLNSNIQKNYDSINKKYLESLKIINSYKAENKKLSEKNSSIEKENIKCKKFINPRPRIY